jgi:hypothetical protein
VTGAQCFDFDNTGFQQAALHEMSFSIPSARYTDKADGMSERPHLSMQARFKLLLVKS